MIRELSLLGGMQILGTSFALQCSVGEVQDHVLSPISKCVTVDNFNLGLFASGS